jgi:copper(I)-binding protein
MLKLTRLRIVEIVVAIVLTLTALVFVGLTVWAADQAGINISDAWARPTIGKSTISAAYLTVSNGGSESDLLKSASSPKAGSIEMHETSMTGDGVMQMRKVENGVQVPAGGSISFSPGGMHLMLIDLREPLEAGGTVPLTLAFERAGQVDVSLPIRTAAPE